MAARAPPSCLNTMPIRRPRCSESSVVYMGLVEQAMARCAPPSGCYQFNSSPHRAPDRGLRGAAPASPNRLHLTCVQDSKDDKGTVDYLQDCAAQARLDARFTYIEENGSARAMAALRRPEPADRDAVQALSSGMPSGNATLGARRRALPVHRATWKALLEQGPSSARLG